MLFFFLLRSPKQICFAAWSFIQGLSELRALRIALFLWIVYGSILAAIVAIQPERRTATLEYQKASENWWQAKNSLYRKKNGYLYLPHFAVLYSPYKMLPVRVGEPLWRLTGLGVLAGALWLASARLAPDKATRLFLTATILVLPSSFSSARNGQVNLPLAGFFIFVALALSKQRWWLGAILLGIMFVMKPIILAPILVFGMLYPQLRIPLVTVVIALAGLLFIHPHPQYVVAEYIHFAENLRQASLPQGFSWCDFSGFLHCLGLHPPPAWQLLVRTAAGVGTLLLAYRALQTNPPLQRALLISYLCVIYLMLFNPRTETNSYVMLGIFVALVAAYSGIHLHKIGMATGFACIAFLLGSENYPIFPWTNLWLKPLLALLLGILLTRQLLRCPPCGFFCQNTKIVE